MTFTAGQTVTVNDPHSFYRGRKATVREVYDHALYVAVRSATGNADICFALKTEHAA